MQRLLIDGQGMTIEDVLSVSEGKAEVHLSEDAKQRIIDGRNVLETIIASGKVTYGVNTGVGALENVIISPDHIVELQRNLVRSTACGVGPAIPQEAVRGMMLLRVNSMALGHSGVRLELVQLLLDMLNRGVHPVVPRKGSLGSSGDLAPLAHIAMVVMGEGTAYYDESILDGAEALSRAGLEPLQLRAKEGIALINGTQYMTASGSISLARGYNLLKTAQIAVAMAVDALKATDSAFDERISLVRPHPGQGVIARNLRSLLQESAIIASHRHCAKVQDSYTLRCAPQVLGACLDAMDYARGVLEIEMNSATDNPLVFKRGAVLSGGNFHGQPVAFALDFLGLAIHQIGNFSERRTARLVDGKLSGLPSFLIEGQGLESGMMIPQYVAASLVNESKLLASPASADSIPSSANQEDFNSMGATSADKLERILANSEYVVAIELLCAAQALEFQRLSPSIGSRTALEFLREGVPKLTHDREMSSDIEWIRDRIRDGSLVGAVESQILLS